MIVWPFQGKLLAIGAPQGAPASRGTLVFECDTPSG